MRILLGLLLAIHGAIHLVGFAKAFGLAELPQVTVARSRPVGLVWLAAALAFGSTGALVLVASRWWWAAGALALVTSQVAIFGAWRTAKAGTLVNLLVALPLALALLDLRPGSLPSTYRHEEGRALATRSPERAITDADLAPLPPLVQTYLRRVGVVGRPRVHDVRVTWSGRMRNGRDGAWMPIHAEQVEIFDHPKRIFYLEASRSGVPFQALHVYDGTSASMRVRVASLFDVVDARGPEMTRSETVTFFNDMCLLAPASLVDAPATWEVLDAHRVRGAFSLGGNTVRADLTFDDHGDLVTFVSPDRALSTDGKHFERLPWSTPVRAYREFDGLRLPARAEAVWTTADGDLPYADFEIEAIAFDVAHLDG